MDGKEVNKISIVSSKTTAMNGSDIGFAKSFDALEPDGAIKAILSLSNYHEYFGCSVTVSTPEGSAKKIFYNSWDKYWLEDDD